MNLRRVMGMLVLATVVLGHPATGLSPHSFYSALSTFPVVNESGVTTTPPQVVLGSWAILETFSGGARQVIHGSGLHPGDAVTSWWVIFNEPQNCTDGECGEDDVLEYPHLSKASMLLGSGAVVDKNGEADFADFLMMGDARKAELGPGLLNPKTAEFHFVLRTHGKAEGRYLSDQLGGFAGGCGENPPHADCRDVQFAVFKQ